MKLDHKFFKDKKIAIVTNKPPITPLERDGNICIEKSVGGLVAALEPLIQELNGSWFCTIPKSSKQIKSAFNNLSYKVPYLELSSKEIEKYYEGYANKQLWPLFHYFPSKCIFHDNDFNIYKDVNKKMADLIIENIDEDTFIWIHDYHFLLLPQMLRERNKNLKIGFFLHIPFPNQELFRLLSNRDELLKGMLGADLIGFHTKQYVEHFINCAKVLKIPGVSVASGNIIKIEDRNINICNFPISIDFDYISTTSASKEVCNKVKELKASYNTECIGISVDRLDYTKGTIERLLAIETFFETYPEYIKRVVFVQLSVPTRTEIETYQKVKKNVDETVGRINGKFSIDGWRPIFYLYRSLPFSELIAYYKMSDFALVVPLRDGMNLVSKEYIASKVDNDGVLILSEFAGAAEELDGAIIVNPYHKGAVAKAIKDSIEINGLEKAYRMKKMRENVQNNTVYKWVDNFFKKSNLNEKTKKLIAS